MVLTGFDIDQMRSRVQFLINNPTAAATADREAVTTGGLNDNYSVLLATRGRLRMKSGNRTLLAGLIDIKETYELICRFQSSLETNLSVDVKILIEGTKLFTIQSWEKIEQIKHLYRFNLNASTEPITLPVESFGPELITNGGFVGNATGWTLGGSWFYNTNKASFNGAIDGVNDLKQSGLLTVGARYRASFNISGSNGFLVAMLGSGTGIVFKAGAGDVSFEGTWEGLYGFIILFTPSIIFDGSITNVSVKAIL